MDTGFLFPGTTINDATVGTIDWTTPDNAKVLDSIYTSCPVRVSGPVNFNSIKLFKAGAVTGNDKSPGTNVTSIATPQQWGSASDLWGATLTPADVNATNFGVGLSIVGNGGTGKYIFVSNFGFSIPTDATINGVLANYDYTDPAGTYLLDAVSIKVFYTLSGGFNIALV